MYRYISDMHFSHKNIIRYDNRPYFSVEEMNDAMIKNWNSVVEPGDTTFILGDFHWGNKNEWIKTLEQLSGDKVLIFGNHDSVAKDSAKVRSMFVETAPYLEVKDDESVVVLSHFPIIAYRNMLFGWKHLYGHVHSMMEYNVVRHAIDEISAYYDKKAMAYNVGCMLPHMGFYPRTLAEIEKTLDKH